MHSVSRLSGTCLLALCTLTAGACMSAGSAGRPRGESFADSVNVGYGRTARRDMTGAVGSMDGEASQRYSPLSVADMLDGHVAGVEVLKRANGTVSVRVRGQRSFMGNEEPLFVLDGVPLTSSVALLRDLNPRDVQRIEVLKGAAASVYGSRGANGVIMISLRSAGR